jgi:fructose-specific phosphotransferase system component IIB
MKLIKFKHNFIIGLIIMTLINIPNYNILAYNNSNHEYEIELLFDQMRANILLQAENPDNKILVDEKKAELKSIDAKLEKLGIVRITKKEVNQIANKHLSISKSLIGARDIEIDKPDDYNGVRWYKSSVSTYIINGKEYESIYLKAVASSLDSPLVKEKKNITYVNRDSFTLAKKNIITYVVKKGVSKFIAEISKQLPIVKQGVALYDAIKATFTGISRTQVIEEVTATVTSRSTTDVKFVYTNEKGKSSAYQQLQLVTTKMSTVTTFDSPVLLKDDENETVTIDAVTGKVQIDIEASQFHDALRYAAQYYANNYQEQTKYVDLDVKIMENKTISVPTATPRFPIHLM